MPERVSSAPEGHIVTDAPELSLEEVCGACGLTTEEIATYVAEGVIEPRGPGISGWRFSRTSVIVLRRARRLECDLGLNAAGVALALELLAEIETLKLRLARFERQS